MFGWVHKINAKHSWDLNQIIIHAEIWLNTSQSATKKNTQKMTNITDDFTLYYTDTQKTVFYLLFIYHKKHQYFQKLSKTECHQSNCRQSMYMSENQFHTSFCCQQWNLIPQCIVTSAISAQCNGLQSGISLTFIMSWWRQLHDTGLSCCPGPLCVFVGVFRIHVWLMPLNNMPLLSDRTTLDSVEYNWKPHWRIKEHNII